jgi:chromosome segregation protein
VHLEKLELQGFKTFVHKTTLNFPQPRGGERRGVAAIVGPNGSGKSNFADALRWVMGEQSLKSLRGKKSEDVIFSGTEKLSRVGLAEVSLYLNNEDKQAPIDYSQVVITRRLFRSGESEYLVNKKRVRLQDVTMLLAEASFGQKTYSIIGQGMVDAILMASPLERKVYFDEASGTRPLQLKREDAEHKLEQTEDNLRQGEVLIQEITPRLRSLTRQVHRLERREAVMQELDLARKKYYGSVCYENSSALTRSRKEKNEAQAKREAAERELAQLEESFAKLEQATSVDERFKKLEADHQRLWDARTVLREKLVEARTVLTSEVKRQRKGESSPEELAGIYYDLEAAVKELVIAAEQSPDEAHAILRRSLERLTNHIRRLKQQVLGDDSASTVERSALEQEVAKLQDEEGKIAATLTALGDDMKRFHEEEQKKNKAVFELERKIRQTRDSLRALIDRENEHNVMLARLTAEKEALDREIAEELSGVVPEPDTTVYSSPEKGNMRQQIEGLKCRLAEIGTIDEETAKEYEETKKRNDFLVAESDDLRRAIVDLRKIIRELDETIQRKFNESFHRISVDFERFFKILFSGGMAKLVRVALPTVGGGAVDADDEGDEDGEVVASSASTERLGIDIQATPPGKRLKNISMLSGGERALTSLALICAIISSNPSPFVVLDEVDAALDEANSVRFAEIIDQLSHRTQFIVITHNRASMQQANILYGITMGEEGASKVLSLKLEDIQKK